MSGDRPRITLDPAVLDGKPIDRPKRSHFCYQPPIFKIMS